MVTRSSRCSIASGKSLGELPSEKEYIGFFEKFIELKNLNLATAVGNDITILGRNGKCLKTLKGHTNKINSLIEWRDSVLVSGAGDPPSTYNYFPDYTIKFWDPNTGKCLNTLVGHKRPITNVIELKKEDILVSSSWDCSIKLWNRNGKCLKTIQEDKEISTIIELKDGNIAGGIGNDIKIWDLSGKCLKTFKGHKDHAAEIIELHDANLASIAFFDTLIIWNRNGKCLRVIDISYFQKNAGYDKNDWMQTLLQMRDGTLVTSICNVVKLLSFPIK